MSEHTKNFIDKLAAGDNAGAGEDFKSALRDKVGTGLDTKRQEIASNMFTAQPFSEPKPEVIDPSPETVPAEMKEPATDGTPDTMEGVDVNTDQPAN